MPNARPLPLAVRRDAGAPQAAAHAALAIAAEADARLRDYARRGIAAAIDLRCLRAQPAAREALERLLGSGGVAATVEALGRTLVQETQVPCLWWVRHVDAEGALRAEFLEVVDVPDILRGDALAVERGLDALGERCAALGRASADQPCTANSEEMP